MGLFQNLYDVYDLLVKQENSDLLPLGFSRQNIQIECELHQDAEGKTTLYSAKVLTKEESPTMLPVTEDSANRTSKPAAHPLFDKLTYISKDYVRYIDESLFSDRQISGKKMMFSLFREELERLLQSIKDDKERDCGYDAEKIDNLVSALYSYLMEENIISDLVEKEILVLNEGKLSANYLSEKTDLLKLLPKPEQEEALVRFIIVSAAGERNKLWEMEDFWKAYLSLKTKSGGKKDICMITGKESLIADKHPRFLRVPGDGAKLISSNDSVNFTYRGRFAEANEATALSFIASEKIHNALKYLIRQQGLQKDGRVFLHFHSKGYEVPKVDSDLFDFLEEGEVEEGKIASPEMLDEVDKRFSKRLHKMLQGYAQEDGYQGTITTLILDAATPGRLSVLFYNELPDNLFFERLKEWHEKTAWENMFDIRNGQEEKVKVSIGAPSIRNIVDAALGKDASDKLKKSQFQRILIGIVQGDTVPMDLVRPAVQRASQPLTMKPFEWEKQLRIACSLYRNYYWKKEKYGMELNRENRDRSYLYGRLLAVADKIERAAQYGSGAANKGEGGEEGGRPTNAWRYMVAFSLRPYKT